MDAIENATPMRKVAKELPRAQIDQFVGKGYGIFSGDEIRWAKLRFSSERARWVSRESWHPEQKLSTEPDGSLLMEVPFTDATELAMDVLRHGHHVEVMEPVELRSAVCCQLQAAMSRYATSLTAVEPG